jgi:hypothetical protein
VVDRLRADDYIGRTAQVYRKIGVTQALSPASFPESPVQFGIFDWIEASGQPASQIFEHKFRLAEIADKGGI